MKKNRPASPAGHSPSQAESPSASREKEEFKPVQPPVTGPVPEFNPGGELKKMLEDLLGGAPVSQDKPVPSFSEEEKIPDTGVPRPHKQHSSGKPAKQSRKTAASHRTGPAEVVAHSPHKSDLKSDKEEHLAHKSKAVRKEAIPELVAEESLETDFDFRQAIIYSEVLKRPDW